MNPFVDRMSVNGNGTNPLIGASGDRYYEGVDLSLKFSAEIATSPYLGDAWAWIRARIRAGDFTGIHVNDYIPFTTTNNVTLKACVAGINTYKGYGDTMMVGNHIDFISRELWPTTHYYNPANFNNGNIPFETITGDGSTTAFVLTKEYYAIDSVKQGDTAITGYTYDNTTHTLTFATAPAAGAITVTGTGSEHPWLASDLYLFLNSLAGHVPNDTTFNPAIAQVDYTAGGVYYYLPDTLKAVIVEKRLYLPKRYNNTKLLTDDNACAWVNIGKLWLPTEFEVYGSPVFGGKMYTIAGSAVQYPLFIGNMLRVKYKGTSRYAWWLLVSNSGNTTAWCGVSSYGNASSTHASLTSLAAPVCFRVA